MKLLSLNKAFSDVDGSKPHPGTAIPATQLAHWKIKDGKAHAEIALHCGDRQIQLVKSLKNSKSVWDKYASTYKLIELATQVMTQKK